MKRTIFVFSSGKLHRKQNTIYFENSQNKKRYLPIENIQEIFIFGEVTINKKRSFLNFVARLSYNILIINIFGKIFVH
jgi:CRISPR-associated protein Cas1